MEAEPLAVVAVHSSSDWMLSSDRAGSGAVVEMECTSCLEGSGPADDGTDPDVWSLRHASRSGHTGFRRIVTDFHRAAPLR
ncbi:hypothetical protein ACODT5_43905 [Streptomyces sp. 5.8]|uniref:DUF7848 domain-containing protein n=1 Tax=Streptomyces sp. 5.8 TaxID=3406571 RepID=UPI003BB62D42